MAKNRVTVYVGGRRLNLVSSESEEYMKNVAKNVNERINLISKSYTQLDARGCAVMAALDFADDEQKALGKKAELVHEANKVLRQADKHSKQIIELKKQNSALDSRCDELKEQVEELKKANANLTAQYNELKKFLDKQVNGVHKNREKEQVIKETEAEKTKADNRAEPLKTNLLNNSGNKNAENEIQPQNHEKASERSDKKAEGSHTKPNEASKAEASANGKTSVIQGKKPKQESQPVKTEVERNGKEDKSDEKAKSESGYIPMRQYSLFDDDNKK
ncbi:MAG: cell division protein ZapA [Ruminococcus sp.]